MEKSEDNGYNIIKEHRDRTFALKDSDPIINDMYLDIEPYWVTISDNKSAQTTGVTERVEFTGIVKSSFKSMATNMNHYQDIYRGTFGKETSEYRATFGKNIDRMYNGPYEVRANAVKALSLKVRTYGGTLIALADEIYAYYLLLTGAKSDQTGGKVVVGMDAVAYKNTIIDGGKIVWKNLGRAIMIYAELENSSDLICALFPVELLHKVPIDGHHAMHIGIGDFERIAILNDKTGKKYRINTMDSLSDIRITSEPNSKHVKTTGGYIALKGQPDVIIDPSLVGSLTDKFITGTTLSPEFPSDFTFDIIDG
jgi:hypothetical protein